MLSMSNQWGWTFDSIPDGTRPPTTSGTMGTLVTPAQNSFGSYVTIIAAADVDYDVWEWEVRLSQVFAAGNARNTVMRVGVDPAGGTSFTKVVDLFCGSPGPAYNLPCTFCFPHRIAAGSTIGVALSVNHSTLTAARAQAIIRGRPTRPEIVRVGKYFEEVGLTLASSSGTAVVQGTTSEGDWTDIGTLTRPCWTWRLGMGVNNAAQNQSIVHMDMAIGDASNKRMVFQNYGALMNSNEDSYHYRTSESGNCEADDGEHVYVRAQSSATADANFSMFAVGVGG